MIFHTRSARTVLEGEGLGVATTAALVKISGTGSMFWMFHPSEAESPATRPLILWLDGVAGLPPSLLANFGMVGPLDFNMNKRNGSWVEEFNLLFVDAPLGTGFSSASSDSSLAKNFDDTTDHLLYVLESFFKSLEEYQKSPLYIYGQGDGAQLALHLTKIIQNTEVSFNHNLQGIILANPIVSPALALTKLGFYLDEMGYVDSTGRVIVEEFTSELNDLVTAGQMDEAFDKFSSLEQFLNEEVGAAAINLRYLIQKLTRGPTRGRDYFSHKEYLRSALQLDLDVNQFMDQIVAPALGISNANYDERRESAMQALKGVFMEPKTNLVEDILSNTNLSVTIINGNLDAVSNTPGQLEWVNNLQWSGQSEFVDSNRLTLIVNGLVEGYFRGGNFGTDRLTFYWMNAAGVSVPLDSPVAARRVIQRITGN
ncbi:hypothetical protein O0L34_g2142 [Tuta absoluta]|nr:hypothetical protein O0L34_g2142 [Tuta absoluta]